MTKQNERRPQNRRTQAAAQTRELILASALRCFSRSGYAGATITDIAQGAGVAVATVYTSVGGKPALLELLVRSGMDDDGVARGVARLAEARTGREVIDILGSSTADVSHRHGEALRFLIDTAVSEPVARAALERAVALSRSAMEVGARRLLEIGGLREDLGFQRLVEVLWYFFGLYSWDRLTRPGADWPWEDAAPWLCQAAARSLLSNDDADRPEEVDDASSE